MLLIGKNFYVEKRAKLGLPRWGPLTFSTIISYSIDRSYKSYACLLQSLVYFIFFTIFLKSYFESRQLYFGFFFICLITYSIYD
jgi:hypothetical protein